MGQKRKRATMGDTPLSPAVPVNLPRGVPSKRPKTTIVKAAAVSSGNAKASPSRTHSGIKRGPSSVHGVSSGSATSGSSSTSAHKRRESNQRIYSVLEQYSKSAQKKEDTGYSHQGRDPLRSRKSTGDSEADLAPIPTPVGASTPKRGARGSSTVEHMMVPPSPSLSSVASPDTRVAGSRSSRQQQLQQNQQQQRQSRISSVPEYISAAGEEDSAPNTPVPTRRSGGTGAGAGSVEVATNFSAPVGRFGTRSSGPSTTTTTAVEVRTPASSTRSTRFSPAGGNKEELLPGLPARSGGGKGKGGGTAQPAAALTALISSNGVVAGTIPTSAGPPTQAPGTVGVIPPYSYVGTSGAATSASAGAVGVGAIDPSAVQHLQALLQQVLVGLLPAALPATPSNSSSSPNGLADFSAPVRQDVVYHKFSASSLPESTWAELFKVGWRCITVDVTDQSTPATTNTTTTSASSSRRNNYNSGGGNGVQGEEIYLTPGTVLTSDAVRDFSRLRLREVSFFYCSRFFFYSIFKTLF